jgi:hypothetical protein
MAKRPQPDLIIDISEKTPSEKYQLACKLGTVKGFYLYYYELLPEIGSQLVTFNAVNHLHYQIFNEYKYSDYDSFRKALVYHLKKNNS